MKVAELVETSLDYAVAVCEQKNISLINMPDGSVKVRLCCGQGVYQPSLDWYQGNPILTKYNIVVTVENQEYVATRYFREKSFKQTGPTGLIAGMRCYVASVFGESISIPKELIK